MTKKKLFLLSALSGIMLFASWPPHGFYPLIFIAFVPLLLAERAVFMNREAYKGAHVFLFSWWAFLIWNLLTTWWIYNASLGGAIMAIVVNAFLMAIIFWLFHLTKKLVGAKYDPLIFICYWISFEFFHMNWDLSWPWLTLGNVFAASPNAVQWYEYTGVFGGSLWVLTVNVLVFELIVKTISGISMPPSKKIIGALAVILPITFSLLINFLPGTERSRPVDVVIVQPNIDPYNEKFSGNYEDQLEKMLKLAEQKVDSNTDYLVFPETALQEDLWENNIQNTLSIHHLKDFIKKFPKLKIVTGASTHYQYEAGEEHPATARKFTDADEYYDAYNTALQIDSSGKIQVYHKSVLVPGVEKMPYPEVFGFLEKFAIDLGGTSGSLAGQKERTVFFSRNGIATGIAPVICYESIYGEFVGEYIRNGAGLVFIITNDGWWGDTPGYKQHLAYASLRAIETRKWIARSANTGISCFIAPSGEQLQKTGWWKEASIKQPLTVEPGETFYTRHGDYIARGTMWLSALIFGFALFKKFRK